MKAWELIRQQQDVVVVAMEDQIVLSRAQFDTLLGKVNELTLLVAALLPPPAPAPKQDSSGSEETDEIILTQPLPKRTYVRVPPAPLPPEQRFGHHTLMKTEENEETRIETAILRVLACLGSPVRSEVVRQALHEPRLSLSGIKITKPLVNRTLYRMEGAARITLTYENRVAMWSAK